MIFFRVDTRCGLGHLTRMKWLALALSERGQQCHFFLEKTDFDITGFLGFVNCQYWVPNGLSEAEDASWCIQQFAQLLTQQNDTSLKHWVIIDHYQLGVSWELPIKESGYQLLAMDDLNRAHIADVIVDAKWQGSDTWKRYSDERLDSKLVRRLLGPEFSILAPEYAEKTRRIKKQQIMFSLGGGGDWTYLTEVIAVLVKEVSLREWSLLVVFGPYAVNIDALKQLSKLYPQIETVDAPNSLLQYYQSSLFFVGALGTSLYELTATQTPALTFALAPNQHNNLSDLADFGHFLHLDSLENISPHAFAELVKISIQNIGRIRALQQSSAIKIDGLGVQRIASFLQSEYPILKYELPTREIDENEQFLLTPALVLRQVVDTDINNYLEARNRADNSWRMTVTDRIPRHEHYRWWFKQQRQSYALEHEGKVLLYVWHQLMIVESRKFWIGGWFAASEQVNFSHAQLILDWQLKFTFKQEPEAIWLAVIHRENKFVQLLNQRAGFTVLEKSADEYEVVEYLFPAANIENFQFFCKCPTKDLP